METEPKPHTNKEKSSEKLTRRKFLKVVSGGLVGLGASLQSGNVEKPISSIKETNLEEQEWLRHVTVFPEANRRLVIEAYESLPPQLQTVLRKRGIEVTFKEGNLLGGAAASDQFGLDISTHSVYVRWPIGAERVSFPWGEIKLVDATRHELSHVALERIFRNNSEMWVDLLKALREEGPEFLEKVAAGHKDAAYLYSNSSMAHYQALQEYLASLVEHCGKPVRVPLPSGRARPMVEALVSGGTCIN